MSKPMILDSEKLRLRHMRASVRSVAGYHVRSVGSNHKPLMITLTYREGVEWDSKHISYYTNRLSMWWLRKFPHLGRLRFCWVAELQKRGAVHYHILVWSYGHSVPFPDKSRMWRHGSSNVIRCKFGGVGYATKYVSKFGSKSGFPKGLRLYGYGGLTSHERLHRRFFLLPQYVKDVFPCFRSDVVRAKGGGWVSRLTGEYLPSAYKVVAFFGSVFAVVPVDSPPDVQSYYRNCFKPDSAFWSSPLALEIFSV